MTDKVCNLCMTNKATQRNSHILPSFLKKEYLQRSRKFFLIESWTGKLRVQQDLPKEDCIFCPVCEDKFNSVETIVSKHLNDSYSLLKRKTYPKINLLNFEYQLLTTCHPKIFALFVYSLVWRLHISDLPIFKDFHLPDNCAEDLRKTLNNILTERTSELIANLDSLNNQRWDFVFIKPENRNNIYSNINYSAGIDKKGLSSIFIFEYLLVFFVNKKAIPKFLENLVNQKFSEPKLMILENKLWNHIADYSARELLKKLRPLTKEAIRNVE